MNFVNFWVRDWIDGTESLDAEQEFCYFRVCLKIYRENGCVADNDQKLARFCKMSVRRYRKLKGELIALGKIEVSGGLIGQKRCEKELKKAANISETQAEKARKKSAKTSPKPLPPNGPHPAGADARAKPGDTPRHMPTSTSSKTSKETPSESNVLPDTAAEFASFWTRYPKKVARRKAEVSFKAARKRASLERIMAGLAAYKRDKETWRQWMDPTTFLNGDRWDDEYQAPATDPSAFDFGLRLVADNGAGHHRGNGRQPGSAVAAAAEVLARLKG